MDMSEWFPVNVVMRQDCVMSLSLFCLYMDGVVREVNDRVLGKFGGTAAGEVWRV